MLMILVFLFTGTALKNGDKVFPNVCVLGINLGGMERDEAEAALEEAVTAQTTRTLTVQLPDRQLVFEPQTDSSETTASILAEAALAYGREGGPMTVLQTYLDCKSSAYILDVAAAVGVDQAYIREVVEDTAELVRQTMEETVVEMNETENVITIRVGRAGRTLNTEGLFQAVVDAYASGDLSDLTYEYDLEPYNLVDLRAYYSKYCTPAQDAYYDNETHTVVKEVVGYGFDLMAVNQQIALAEEGSVIEIPLQTIQPRITAENWKEENYPDVLAAFSSPHVYNPNRTENLRLACQAIDGTVIKPGEIFSFNAVVGERTEEKGYREGIVYADGGASEAEIGGGICQVASTIYMACLLADLEVTERAPHMYAVTYVDMGMDANVYWGVQDFKFRNTNSTPIMLNASVSGGKVHITISGIFEHDYTVKMSYELLSTIPYEEVEEEDPTLPAGTRKEKHTPYTGYTCWSYKSYYDLNGNFLRKEKCAYSEYDKRDHVFLVGTEGRTEDWNYEEEIPPARPDQTQKPQETDKKPQQSGNTGNKFQPKPE